MRMSKALVRTINQIAGRPVDITPTSGGHFTLSFYTIDKEATRRICEFFSNHAKTEVVEYNEDCETYIYLSI